MLRSKNSASEKGFVLVFSLFFVALLSFLIVSFLSRTLTYRKIFDSSDKSIASRNLSDAAIRLVIGELREEIRSGSTPDTTPYPVYRPMNPVDVLLLNVTGEPENPIKVSGEKPLYYKYGEVGKLSGLGERTDEGSSGNRFNAKYWGRRLEITDREKVPSWIYYGKEGVVHEKGAKRVGNIIGRFAFAVHDLGNALDINVAGAPSEVASEFLNGRSSLAQIPGKNFPFILNPKGFLNWRNPLSSLFFSDYEKQVLKKKGAPVIFQGERAFLSRADLIDFVKQNPGLLSSEDLPSMTIFSRKLNAPTHTPKKERAKAKAGSFAYGLDDEINPSLITTRDGDGRPLLHRRFALDSLAMVRYDATSTDEIYKKFGLRRSNPNSRWLYDHGNPSKILTLSEIVRLKRDPDFFELLKAGIQAGSLGRDCAPNQYSHALKTTQDQNSDLQILQIGAHLIDQWDADSYPTGLLLGQEEVNGGENLPMLTGISIMPYRKMGGTRPNFSIWIQAFLWNPNANPLSSDLSLSPTNFRFIAKPKNTGVDSATIYIRSYNPPFPPTRWQSTPWSYFNNSTAPAGINFTLGPNNRFPMPTYLTPGNASAKGDNYVNENSPSPFLGVYVGTAWAPEKNLDAAETVYWDSPGIWCNLNNPIDFLLQYNSYGTWVTYSQIRFFQNSISAWYNYSIPSVPVAVNRSFATSDPTKFASDWVSLPDPRTDRFGGFSFPKLQFTSTPDVTIKENSIGNGFSATVGTTTPYITSPHWTFGGISSFYPAYFSQNTSQSPTRYSDWDGVIRRADGAYAVPGALPGFPLARDNFSSRPIVLNRAFRSVGEMGYAFRGEPWKSINFFTSESGDAALLDLFCLHESPEDGVQAGTFSLNTTQSKLYESLLQGATLSEEDGQTIASQDVQTIAQQIVEQATSSSTPCMENKSDFVTQRMELLRFSGASDQTIKRRRESVVRSLAEIPETRAWNLLIDLVAQTGTEVLPPGKSQPQFKTESQSTVVLHLSIDRFTGKIIDSIRE